ncbi:MAG: hypothetical protein M1140_10455, partial [Chloroflexi bacterium]|nr:hypothetical protein [Chloroflexota bacterium]
FVELHTADGGYGEPYFYNVLRFCKEGIQGRVTLNGVNASGITVHLILDNGSTTEDKGTTNTGSDGIYQFTNAATLTGAQKYYVYYTNQSNSSRLWAWYTAYVASPYTYGQRAYAGNFDIANMTLGSPNGNLYYPYTFSWTRRPNSPTDKYYLQIAGDGGPYYNGASLGYVSSTSLYGIPSGFSTGAGYYWYVVIESPDYGAGVPYYSSNVTFW